MLRRINAVIDQTTMYRLVLYVLLGYIAAGAVLAQTGRLAFSPIELLGSTAFLVLMCWAANSLLAGIFDVPTNIESATLTALILALILDPAKSFGDLSVLGWAAILAMASKYILAIHQKHLFNPAAISAVIIGYALNQPAGWWVGTADMLPVVLLGGLLIVRKVRQGDLVLIFLLTALIAESVAAQLHGTPVPSALRQLLVQSPLIFFASVMLTEPLTAPPTTGLKRLYGLLTGVLFIPQIHVGSIYSTPELALVIGNLYAYLVSPKQKFVLTLKRKTRLSPDTIDFAFSRPPALAFAPGQYMEWTLGHARADRRGNRRYFTLASSPTEPMLHLGVKLSKPGSSFKQALRGLNSRTSILAGQVAGDFTLPKDPRLKLAFIAGGIGITPFRSMLKYLIDTGQQRDIIVLYTARAADDFVYADVLREARVKLGVPTIYTLTDTAAIPRKWSGEVGRIDRDMLTRFIPDYYERTFYLSGPPEMVRATERVLRSLRVPSRQIKKDFFAGLA